MKSMPNKQRTIKITTFQLQTTAPLGKTESIKKFTYFPDQIQTVAKHMNPHNTKIMLQVLKAASNPRYYLFHFKQSSLKLQFLTSLSTEFSQYGYCTGPATATSTKHPVP